MLLKYLLIPLILLSIVTCRPKPHSTEVTRGFYYWQSNPRQLEDSTLTTLQKEHIQKLYVKFFEVEPDELFGNVPSSKSALTIKPVYNTNDTLRKNVYHHLTIVPTVFIRNSVLKNINTQDLDTLAYNIVFLVEKYYSEKYTYYTEHKINYNEIQIDCDWTMSTKDAYFYLLKKIKAFCNKPISATLRLYAYKYPDKMGVLPVDRAMLMCYNLENPLKNPNKNSILDINTFESYLKKTPRYPIPLDIALPVYDWMHWYHLKQFQGIIYNTKYTLLEEALLPTRPFWYVAKKNVVVDNILIKAGDEIKLERINANTIHQTIALLQKHVSFSNKTTVALFHLDTKLNGLYSYEELDSFYSDFTK
jgi:hypothetical protein